MINGDHNNEFFQFSGSMGSVSSLSMKLPMLIWLEDRCYATAMQHSDESAQKDPQKSIMTTTGDYHLPDG